MAWTLRRQSELHKVRAASRATMVTRALNKRRTSATVNAIWESQAGSAGVAGRLLAAITVRTVSALIALSGLGVVGLPMSVRR